MNATELTLENGHTETQRQVQQNCFIAGHRLRIYFSLKMIANFLHSLLNVFNFLDDKHYQKKFFKIITHNMELNYMPEQNVIYLR